MVEKTPSLGGNLWGFQGHGPTGSSDPQGNEQATRNSMSRCSIHSWRKMLELQEDIPIFATYNARVTSSRGNSTKNVVFETFSQQLRNKAHKMES